MFGLISKDIGTRLCIQVEMIQYLEKNPQVGEV